MKSALVSMLLLVAGLSGAERQTINIIGDAEIKVVPDRVVLSLGIEVHSKTLAEARRENSNRVQRVLETVRRMGVDQTDIQTDFIQLGVSYQNDDITPQYYYARKTVVIVLKDVNRMEEVLASAVDAGATHIHGVSFETSKLRQHRDHARALAVKAATEKAHAMAAAAGLKVSGNAVGISSSNSGGRSWYGSGWGMGSNGYGAQNVVQFAGGGDSNLQGTISLGRISVTASVSMSFVIE